jgi:predicted SprT family Zn-dependent metalloprotease
MELAEARALGYRLLGEFLPGQGWAISFDRSKKRLGACFLGKRVISLSEPVTRLNDVSVIENTLRHEIAHALAGYGHDHDATWRRMCVVTGARPETCTDSRTVVMPSSPYSWVCPKCEADYPIYRRPKYNSRYTCKTCRVEVNLVRN